MPKMMAFQVERHAESHQLHPERAFEKMQILTEGKCYLKAELHQYYELDPSSKARIFPSRCHLLAHSRYPLPLLRRVYHLLNGQYGSPALKSGSWFLEEWMGQMEWMKMAREQGRRALL